VADRVACLPAGAGGKPPPPMKPQTLKLDPADRCHRYIGNAVDCVSRPAAIAASP